MNFDSEWIIPKNATIGSIPLFFHSFRENDKDEARKQASNYEERIKSLKDQLKKEREKIVKKNNKEANDVRICLSQAHPILIKMEWKREFNEVFLIQIISFSLSM